MTPRGCESCRQSSVTTAVRAHRRTHEALTRAGGAHGRDDVRLEPHQLAILQDEPSPPPRWQPRACGHTLCVTAPDRGQGGRVCPDVPGRASVCSCPSHTHLASRASPGTPGCAKIARLPCRSEGLESSWLRAAVERAGKGHEEMLAGHAHASAVTSTRPRSSAAADVDAARRQLSSSVRSFFVLQRDGENASSLDVAAGDSAGDAASLNSARDRRLVRAQQRTCVAGQLVHVLRAVFVCLLATAARAARRC